MPNWIYIPTAASSGWLPSDLASLAGWWDASDSATLFDATTGGSTPAASGGVARWEDKSGDGRHFTQATSGDRPTRQTSIQNSRDVVRFDGSSDYMDQTDFIYDLGACTIGVVLKVRTDGFAFGFGEGSTSDNNPLYYPVASNTNAVACFYRDDAGGPTVNYVQGANVGTTNFQLVVMTDSGSDIKYGLNGTAPTSIVSGSYSRSTTTLSTLRIGAISRSTANFFAAIDFAEICVFDAVLGTADREKLEGYLAHKWGRDAELPSGHPYKNSAP